MAADIKSKFDTSASITITLASLASGSARQSTALDFTSSLYLDAFIAISPKLASGTPSGDKCVRVWLGGSIDGGTTYTGGATGSDAAYTLATASPLQLLFSIYFTAGGVAIPGGPMAIGWAFGNRLPPKAVVIVENATGVALDSTEGNHVKTVQGTWDQVV